MSINQATNARRKFLKASAGGALLLAGCADGSESHGEQITPSEELMREHAVLHRILIVYDEAWRRLAAAEELPLDALAGAARQVRFLVEDHHQRLEEELVFPRFEQARKHTELVAVLRRQHAAGRAVTDRILQLASGTLRDEPDRRALAQSLRAFSRMSRPHAAHEDSVVLPALHGLMGGPAYAELGDLFAERGMALLGAGGLQQTLAETARIEVALGLDDLARFTAS